MVNGESTILSTFQIIQVEKKPPHYCESLLELPTLNTASWSAEGVEQNLPFSLIKCAEKKHSNLG